MARAFKRILCSPALIIGVAFAARLVLLWKFTAAPIRNVVPFGYELGRVARAIAAGNGFSSPLRMVDTGPTAWFTPIYPYFVAAIFKIWGIYSFHSKIVVRVLNCAFVSLAIIPIQNIARRTFGEGVGVAAAWIWVFLPTSLFFPVIWDWDTSLTALVFGLIFWATLALRENQTLLSWAGYGALWVFGALINPSIVSVFPFLLGWLAWESRKNSGPWKKLCAAALLVFVVGLVPWTVRNYRVFGRFIVFRSNFGLELWLGNNPSVPDTWSPWLHPNDSLEEAQKYKRMGEIAFMAEKQHEAIAFMRTHPADTLHFVFRRFINNWLAITDNPADAWSSSPLYLKAFIVINFLSSLFTLIGALFAYRSKPADAPPYLMVLLVFPLIFYLTHSSLRYRFPMDPIMMVLAAYGAAYPISQWLGRTSPQRDKATAAPAIPTT